MTRQEEIENALNGVENLFDGPVISEKRAFKKGVVWADSHPSLEVVEKIINLAFDGWDSIEDFHSLAQSIKEEIENEIPDSI